MWLVGLQVWKQLYNFTIQFCVLSFIVESRVIELKSQTQDRTPAHWCPFPFPLSTDLSFTLHLSHRAAEFKISLVSVYFISPEKE